MSISLLVESSFSAITSKMDEVASKFPIKINNKIYLRRLKVEHSEKLFAITDNNRAYLRQWLPWLDTYLSPIDSEK
jgi:hypothetical protein